MPKVGPFRSLSFKPPLPETERKFVESFNRTLAEYRTLLSAAGRPRFSLPNRDFDTGELTRPAEYKLADQTYARLAGRLAQSEPAAIDPKLRADILEFFANPDLPYETRRHPKQWEETLAALSQIKAAIPQGSAARTSPVVGRR
jgi:hypothetical protein